MVRKVRSRCAFIASSAIAHDLAQAVERPDPPARRAAPAPGRGPGRGAAALSATISPSLISTIRRARRATFTSWVTMMTVRPSAFSSSRMRSTSSPLRLSSAPVGSSARITSPPFISARAIETRCCCPPESCPGR